MVKLIIVALLACGLAFCQTKTEITVTDVRFDTDNCVLTWTSERDGGPARTFKIDLHAGKMTDGEKSFPLAPEEQADMHEVFHQAIVMYAASSVVWFDKGGVYSKPEDEKPMKASNKKGE